MKLSVASLSLIFFALIAGCTRGVPTSVTILETANSQANGSFPVSNERLVIVQNTIGPVILKWGGVEDSIRWTLSRQVTGENKVDAVAFLNSIQLVQQLNRDTVRYFAQSPAGVSGFTFSSTVTVGVPYRMSCLVDGVQGATTVADIGAPLAIRNVHAVTVQRLNASCTIVSIDGGVSCEVALPPAGSCVITAAKGTITLKVPTNTSANITARTTNGSISYSNLTFAVVNQQGGILTGRLAAGNGQIQLETGEGNIVIQGIVP